MTMQITEAEIIETPKLTEPEPEAKAPSAPAAAEQPVVPTPAPQNVGAPKPQEQEPKRDALAVVGTERAFHIQLEPRNPKEADWLARCLFASKQFKDLVSVEAAYAKLAVGRSMGLTLYQSLSLHMFQGRVVKPAMMIVAQVRQHPMCEFFRKRSGDAEHAIWETKRRGDPRIADWEYTIGEAKGAQLVKPDSGWHKYPKNMLSWRAATFLAREEWAEVVGDFLTPEEVEDMRNANAITTTGVAA